MYSKQPPKPFCKGNWKLEGMIYIFLITVMIMAAGYIYTFGNTSAIFQEFYSSATHKDLGYLEMRNQANKSTPQQQPAMGNVAMQQVNFMQTIENVHLRSVANIKGLAKDGTLRNVVDLGSGVIIHEQGYVLTNLHIVQNAHKFKITVFNDVNLPEVFKAEVIKTNHQYNLALLKIVSNKTFSPIYMGNSTKNKLGERVFALGNPYGNGLIDVPGLLTMKHQNISVGNTDLQNLYIIDAPINWENSGGPLINMAGEAIGLNMAIYSQGNMEPVYAAVPLRYGFKLFKDVMDKPNNTANLSNVFDGNLPDWNASFGMPAAAGLFMLGLFSGLMSGMLSMGGGLILVSGLIFVFHYGIVIIRPIAFLANFFTSGASAYQYMKSELLDFTKIAYLLPSAIIGLIVGYFVGNNLGMEIIQMIVAIFALLVSLKLIYELLNDDHPEETENANEEPKGSKILYLLGLPMGFFSGVLGISGGVIEVPLQKAVLKTPLKKAIANSSGMIFFTSMLGVFLSLADATLTGSFDWHVPITIALFVIPGTILGGQLGAYLTVRAPMKVVKLVFAVIMMIIAYMMFFN